MRTTSWFAASVPVLLIIGIGASGGIAGLRGDGVRVDATEARFQVSGKGVLFISKEVVHSTTPTPTGLIQRSSVGGVLTGDLDGSFLFIPISTFDFVNGTLVNTGTQFFSGTIAGSDPVILHDDSFRFEIDLNTGETHGTAHFSRSNDSPHDGGWFECELVIVGTGITAEGDLTSDYSGECIGRGAIS